jgi:outer membrane protein assembly factor BamB
MIDRVRLGVVLAVLVGTTLGAADWPTWRGPLSTGVTNEAGLPVTWSDTENVAWTAPLAGLGVSTPIVSGNRIFVTSQVGTAERRAGNHPRLAQGGDAASAGERALEGATSVPLTFIVEAFNRADGKRVWEYRLTAEGPFAPVHDKHNLATPSPVTDGTLLYAWFGTGQIVALDMKGSVVWQRHLGREIAPFEINWGHTSSPALHEDLLILLCDHDPASYILAVDKKTGKDRWKADRGKARNSYSTPLVVNGPNGAEMIVNSSQRVDAYDPATGKLLWHVGDANRFPIPMPVVHEGVVYMSRGYRSSPYLSLRPGGRGDITSSHVNWSQGSGAPYVSSLVYDRGLIYMANDVAVLTAAEAETGKKVWQERVEGTFSASPIAADGKIYFVSETGETFVIQGGSTPKIIARNRIAGRALASPAASNGQLFIRTDAKLYAIGKGAGSS